VLAENLGRDGALRAVDRKSLAAVLALVCSFALCRPAHAGDTVTAEVLFREGKSLMDAGDYAAACAKLSESYAQDPATGTLLALALCQEQAGRTASAWATFAEVASRAKRDGRSDREQAAREHVQALEPKLSRLTITVAEATAKLSGLVVQRDGVAVSPGVWGTGVPVDPGEHAIEVSAPGKRPWAARVNIGAASDVQAVQVPVLEDAPQEQSVGVATNAVPVPDSADATSASQGPPLRLIGLVVGGAGVVGLGLSAYFGLHAKSLYNDSNSDGHCDPNGECDSYGLEKRESAISSSTAATVSLIAGGIFTVTGATLFFVGAPKQKQQEAARLEAVPAVAPGVAAMFVRGRF
jgi:serine/threonine-protein kinase